MQGPSSNVRSTAQQAIDVYLLSKQPDGSVGGIGWWQTANGYTAIALHDLWSGSRHNYEMLSTSLRQCERQHHKFINEFNDDSLWWALCCLHVYTIGQDTWFLDRARSIWSHVRGSVCCQGKAKYQGMDMEGACFWTTKPGEEQINAITTGLYAELSVRLALIDCEPFHSSRLAFWKKDQNVSRDEYITAARLSFEWILRCRYREEDAVVLDNILLKQQKAQDWTFTYNTGVALGVCALLYEATQDEKYLKLACTMAQKSMCRSNWVEGNGVLTECSAYGKNTHEASQNNDAVGFKAVLVRQLATLYSVLAARDRSFPGASDIVKSIGDFIRNNFQAQQDRNTNGQGQYGPWWNGPFDMPTSHSQMAVLDLMAAAALIDRG